MENLGFFTIKCSLLDGGGVIRLLKIFYSNTLFILLTYSNILVRKEAFILRFNLIIFKFIRDFFFKKYCENLKE